jgi:hypothetical protein
VRIERARAEMLVPRGRCPPFLLRYQFFPRGV